MYARSIELGHLVQLFLHRLKMRDIQPILPSLASGLLTFQTLNFNRVTCPRLPKIFRSAENVWGHQAIRKETYEWLGATWLMYWPFDPGKLQRKSKARLYNLLRGRNVTVWIGMEAERVCAKLKTKIEVWMCK